MKKGKVELQILEEQKSPGSQVFMGEEIRTRKPVEVEPDDNWKHRASKMRCKTCMWWVEKGDFGLGRCRRHAPTLGGWPAVWAGDWCGDHKLDENKI